jgi:hypothetical protein
LTKAKPSKGRCGCPGAQPGIINTDPIAHVVGCWVRKRLLSYRYTVSTSAVPNKFFDGYSLGVATK